MVIEQIFDLSEGNLTIEYKKIALILARTDCRPQVFASFQQPNKFEQYFIFLYQDIWGLNLKGSVNLNLKPL
jgi:hypothetical protein